MDPAAGEGTPSSPAATPENVTLSKEEFEAIKKRADVSSQNFERVKKLEEENALLKTPKESSPPVDAKFIDDKVDLRLEGYTHSEIDEIATMAKAKGISLKEAKDLPIVKAGITAMRAENKSKDQTPPSSNRAIVYKGKTFKEIISDPESTNEDKQAAYDARRTMRVKHNE